MDTAGETISGSTYPDPPRWWWTKRIFIVALIVTLGLAIAWNWWAREAQRRVEAAGSAIRARGEPIDARDFEVAPIPDPLNAAQWILAAVGKIPTNEVNFIANLPVRMENAPLTAADRQGIQRVAKASTTMQSLVRTARFQPGIVWSNNILNAPIPFASQTSLPRTLLVDALHEHLAGNDAAAIEIVRDMLFVADSLDRPKPSLIMHLLAMVNGSITFDTVAKIAPDLQVMPATGATTQPTGPASREQVAALIRELLNDHDMQKGLVRGFQVERAHVYSALDPANRAFVQARSSPLTRSFLAWPWVQLEVLRSMRAMDAIIAAADAADLSAEQAALLKQDHGAVEQANLTTTVHALSEVGFKFGARLEQHLITLSNRRIAAIRLAVRLYQLDHDGNFPAQLDELVPTYLPTLPLDPTAAGGKQFTYRRSPAAVITSHRATFPLIKTQPSAPATTSSSSKP